MVEELGGGFAAVSRYVTVDGYRLHCLTAGDGETVVLLHGLPFCSAVWHGIMPVLAGSYRVVAPDLLGIGRSDKPLDFSYTITNLTRMTAEALESLALGPITLVGLDLGGTIALDLAAQARVSIARLILLNTTVSTEFAFPWFHLLAAKPSYYWEVFRLSSARGVRRVLAPLLGNPEAISEEVLNLYAECFADPAAVWALAKIMETVAETEEEYLARIRRDLSTLEIPVDILWGERDEFLPAECGRRIQRLIPGASFAVVPGVGHLFVEERPEALIDLISKAHPVEGALDRG